MEKVSKVVVGSGYLLTLRCECISGTYRWVYVGNQISISKQAGMHTLKGKNTEKGIKRRIQGLELVLQVQ